MNFWRKLINRMIKKKFDHPYYDKGKEIKIGLGDYLVSTVEVGVYPEYQLIYAYRLFSRKVLPLYIEKGIFKDNKEQYLRGTKDIKEFHNPMYAERCSREEVLFERILKASWGE